MIANNASKAADNKSTIVNASRENDPSYWDNAKSSKNIELGAMGGMMAAAGGMMAGTIAATAGAALVPILAGALVGAIVTGVETLA
jgi:hypothetical protein